MHRLYPGKIKIVLKTGNGITFDRLWDAERCPCLGCNDFYNRHLSIQIYAKMHEEMYANMEALKSV
jgi:hypothetical protein